MQILYSPDPLIHLDCVNRNQFEVVEGSRFFLSALCPFLCFTSLSSHSPLSLFFLSFSLSPAVLSFHSGTVLAVITLVPGPWELILFVLLPEVHCKKKSQF